MISVLFRRPILLPLLMLAMSATPLTMALVSQYGFGLHPCELCIWQRIPYVVLITISLLGLLFFKRTSWVKKCLVLSLLLWLVEAGLAAYHVGVEQHWWESASGCTAGDGGGQSIDDLKAMIENAPLVACDQPEFILLGLSMAGWNLLYSLSAALLLFIIIRKGAKHGATG